MPALIELTGRTFERLTVIERTPMTKGKRPKWVCQCQCGKTCIARSGDLLSGHHRSCGCLQIEATTKHGHAPLDASKTSPTYRSWQSMRSRCGNPKAIGFEHYGGRGITVCERWQDSFATFLADMGERPRGTSIDRFPDMNGNYEPGNCRWATRREQNNNRRDCRMIEHEGRTQSLTDWCRDFGLNAHRITGRLNAGLSFAEAIKMSYRAAIKARGPSKRRANLVGQRFDKLLVISQDGFSSDGKSMWSCQCVCGGVSRCRVTDLRRGKIKSCGCNRGRPGVVKPRV